MRTRTSIKASDREPEKPTDVKTIFSSNQLSTSASSTPTFNEEKPVKTACPIIKKKESAL